MEQLSHPTQALDCSQLLELVPEYCLGTASPDEIAQIEANLDRCPALQAELDAYYALTDQLLHSSPHQSAPASLKTGVLAKIQAAPSAIPVPIALPPRPAALVTPLPRRMLPLRPLTGLVAALIIVLIGTNIFWWQHTDTAAKNEPPVGQFSSDGSLVWFQLVSSEPQQATAWCIWSKTSGQGVLVAENFPEPPPGESYQVWINRDSQNYSLGLLQIDNDGKGVLVLPEYSFKGQVAGVNVTYEPAGGSEWPTGKALVWSEFNRNRQKE